MDLAPGDLKVERLVDGARVVLALRGELDLASAPTLNRELDAVLRGDFADVVIDLAGVTFIDSSGLHCLIGARDAAARSQRALSLRPGGEQVQRLFEMTGLIDVFTFDGG